MFFRAPCNNPLVNCWLLQEWDRQLRLQNVTKASQKAQKSHCPWSLRGVYSFSFPCFVEKFCFGCISRSLKVLNCITVALGKMSQVIQSHKNSLHFRWGFLQDGLPRPIVLKELSDSSDSRLFRVYRGWFCPQLYRDCTWPKIWWFFWWFSRRDLALSPNDRWRFIKDHGEIHHPKKRSLVGHDLPGGYVTLDISPSDSWRLKKSILPKLPGGSDLANAKLKPPKPQQKLLYVSWWRASQRYNC